MKFKGALIDFWGGSRTSCECKTLLYYCFSKADIKQRWNSFDVYFLALTYASLILAIFPISVGNIWLLKVTLKVNWLKSNRYCHFPSRLMTSKQMWSLDSICIKLHQFGYIPKTEIWQFDKASFFLFFNISFHHSINLKLLSTSSFRECTYTVQVMVIIPKHKLSIYFLWIFCETRTTSGHVDITHCHFINC